MRFPRPPLIALLLLACPAPASAQQTTAGADAPDWYEVEVVVFRQWQAGGPDREFWPEPEQVPPPTPVTVDSPAPATQRPPRGPAAAALQRLPDSRMELTPVAQRLAEAGQYDVLLHLGWRQAGLPDDRAPALVVPAGWQAPLMNLPASTDPAAQETALSPFPLRPPGVDLYGTLRLIRSRYLHLEVDLRYQPQAVSEGWAGALPASGPLYRLTERRRLRSGELHYLDHPAIGVVAQVRRWEPSEEGAEAEEGAGTEAPAAQPAAAQ